MRKQSLPSLFTGGSVRLETTQNRATKFRHRAATAELLGVPVEFVGPGPLREL